MKRRTLLATMIIGPIAEWIAGAAMAFQPEERCMFAITNIIRCQEGMRDNVARIIAEGSAQLPGCRYYALAFHANDPDAILVSEVWDSEEDHAASLSNPRVRAAIGQAGPMLAGAERVQSGELFQIVNNSLD